MRNHLSSDVVKQGCEKYVTKKIQATAANYCFFYHVAKCFHLKTISHLTQQFIERRFETVSKSDSFNELTFESVAKILSSSQLHVDSEMHVLRAALKWAKVNGREPSALLSKVRLHLLRTETLNSLLASDASLKPAVLKAVELKSSAGPLAAFKWQRRCDQQCFGLIIIGGEYKRLASRVVAQSVFEQNFKLKAEWPSMNEARVYSASVVLNGTIYVFSRNCHIGSNETLDVEAYTPGETSWRVVGKRPSEHKRFCACAFEDRIYLLGGDLNVTSNATRTCFSYDPQNNDWREIEKMRKKRTLAACCVFAGKIVVSGGSLSLNVDFYDPETNSWTYMASMIHHRISHCSVPTKDKIYMIGGNGKALSNEVFDAYSKTFTLIQAFPWTKSDRLYQPVTAVCIGKRIIAFVLSKRKIIPLVFDVDLEKWCYYDLSFSSRYRFFTIVKLPL